jgi:hypothetical protein
MLTSSPCEGRLDLPSILASASHRNNSYGWQKCNNSSILHKLAKTTSLLCHIHEDRHPCSAGIL